METVSVSHSRDHGYRLEITDVPFRWLAAGKAGELVLAATGHLLCCRVPEWAGRIRWGPVDDEGWTSRSLGWLMFRAGQWLSCGITFSRERTVAVIDVTPEWVQEHYPETRSEFRFLEDGPDAMTVTFSED